jgi:hypothetical protein
MSALKLAFNLMLTQSMSCANQCLVRVPNVLTAGDTATPVGKPQMFPVVLAASYLNQTRQFTMLPDVANIGHWEGAAQNLQFSTFERRST